MTYPCADPFRKAGITLSAAPACGKTLGQTAAATLTSQGAVEQAREAAQPATERTVRQAGYPER